jgi:hypothetical protein
MSTLLLNQYGNNCRIENPPRDAFILDWHNYYGDITKMAQSGASGAAAGAAGAEMPSFQEMQMRQQQVRGV